MNGYDNTVSSVNQNQTQLDPSSLKRKPSSRIQIKNLPQGFTQEGINKILGNCGSVKRTNIINTESGQFVNVTFETPEEAQKAVEVLNDKDYDGSSLKVELMTNNSANGRSGRLGNGMNRQKNIHPTSNSRGTGFPLRLLVPSEYVGAIIGRKGQNIRTITTRCKARVDVHGKENSGLPEKVISIFGQPENCTNACREILLVMQQEATTNNRGEVMLKMLTDDRFCGRIIGREGKMIKKIRDETGTKITVSNAQEMASLFPDRVIAIRGQVEGMAQAQCAISAKLADCMEQELASNMGGMMMMPPLGTNASYYPNNRQYDTSQNYYGPMYAPMGQHSMGPASGMAPGAPINETCQIAVPNAAVGAIIGTAGANIKQTMRESGAFVNIESKKDGDPAVERLVTIKGNLDACWRASYLIFEKMKVEGFGGNEDVRLKTMLRIPKAVVGRIIGKGGKNVRELQRTTGAMVKLPEDPSVQGDEVVVEVYGNFLCTQAAHSRIRSLTSHSQQQQQNQQIYSNGGMRVGGGQAHRRSLPPMGGGGQTMVHHEGSM
jgi:insulin-like growth factor 2 mRNA-binding protein 1